MDPLLTVVVPVHGVAAYLPACLDSVLAGGDPDVEVVAVDDASPDGCGALLDAYAAAHPALRVVHLPVNVGLGRARNAGLERVHGRYVWFVDGDDLLPPGAVPAVLAALRAGDPDVLLLDHLRVAEDGSAEPDASSPLLRGGGTVAGLAGRPALLGVQHTAWNRVVRRALLAELGLVFEAGWYEDVPFGNPVLVAARRITVLDRVCYHYRVGRAGAITATRSDRHFEAFAQYDRLFAWAARHGAPDWAVARLFTLMVDHLLVVAGNDGRLHPSRRRAFFRAIGRAYRRHRPAGYLPPAGVAGLKHRLVAWHAYPVYAALRLAHRLRRAAAVGPERTPAVRPRDTAEPRPAQPAALP